MQEARSVNQIGHVNIVDIFAFGELADGRPYYVMEWLQGESLYDRLARGALDHVATDLDADQRFGIVRIPGATERGRGALIIRSIHARRF